MVDGLADEIKNSSTPLKRSNKPNMNFFANKGRVGNLEIVPKKIWNKKAAGSISHFANLLLLGYDIKYLKDLERGPLEAIGSDLKYKNGYLAARCNFATIGKKKIIIERRAGRNSYMLDNLAKEIEKKVKIKARFKFKRVYKHRAVLIIEKRLSKELRGNDPFKKGKALNIKAISKKGLESEKIIKEFLEKACKILEKSRYNELRIKKGILPANYILIRDFGNKIPKIPEFSKIYKVNPVCISEKGAVRGSCKIAGFKCLEIKSEDYKNGLDEIFSLLKRNLKKYNFFFIHVKWTDEASHDGNLELKKRIIEYFDKKLSFFKKMKKIVLIITCDHITSTYKKSHIYGKVPLLVYGKSKDNIREFDEISCKKGSLKNFNPKKLWRFVFEK